MRDHVVACEKSADLLAVAQRAANPNPNPKPNPNPDPNPSPNPNSDRSGGGGRPSLCTIGGCGRSGFRSGVSAGGF